MTSLSKFDGYNFALVNTTSISVFRFLNNLLRKFVHFIHICSNTVWWKSCQVLWSIIVRNHSGSNYSFCCHFSNWLVLIWFTLIDRWKQRMFENSKLRFIVHRLYQEWNGLQRRSPSCPVVVLNIHNKNRHNDIGKLWTWVHVLEICLISSFKLTHRNNHWAQARHQLCMSFAISWFQYFCHLGGDYWR